MYIGTARRTTVAAFIRRWLRQQHETAKENERLEVRPSFQTEPSLWFSYASTKKSTNKRSCYR